MGAVRMKGTRYRLESMRADAGGFLIFQAYPCVVDRLLAAEARGACMAVSQMVRGWKRFVDRASSSHSYQIERNTRLTSPTFNFG